MEIFKAENLSFKYPNSDKTALSGINMTVSKGDFFVICGYSGCGKTTLLRLLKPALSPVGEMKGDIFFCNKPLRELSSVEAAQKIGFVMQSPDSQTVTDKVWHELAFSMENLAFDSDTIRRRTAETAAFFGIEQWFDKEVSELSGGQKQILALACAMVLLPEVLILDEPTSQLDPIASGEFLSALLKVNRELGTTVILSEHSLEDVFAYANKAAVMENGSFTVCSSPQEVGLFLREKKSPMFSAMPVPMRVWGSVETDLPCPLTVNGGREFLSRYAQTHTLKKQEKNKKRLFGEEAVCIKELRFRYEKDGRDILRGLDMTAHSGELFCILGGNASGKTTTLKIIAGIKKALSGQVKINGTVGYLPQNVQALFTQKTVIEELYGVLDSKKLTAEECEKKVGETALLCGITDILYCHPYDISGGQQQKAAIAKVLLSSPDILLLDEPTKSLDAPYKKKLAQLLIKLKNSGKCIIAVSHDLEFCAEYSDTCALLFGGVFTSVCDCSSFFCSNSFYTTSANRMARHIDPDIVTVGDALYSIGAPLPLDSIEENEIHYEIIPPKRKEVKKLSLLRKVGAFLSGAAALIIMILSASNGSLTDFISYGSLSSDGIKQLAYYGIFIFFIILLALFLGKGENTHTLKNVKPKKEKLPKRTKVCTAVSLLLIPLTIFASMHLFEEKQYYITAFLVIIECMLPFAFVFEGRKYNSRKIVTIAVLCAVGVAGRAVFFMLPQFKPVAAIVIISGVMLGGEVGFAVGAVTMLVSNMLFSQGVWTVWQMLAMGLIGLFAGILSKKGLLSKNRISLCVFGFISTYLIYGALVNASTALMWGGEGFSFKVLAAYYISGFPLDTIHAVSTVIFLWFGAQPIMDILERVKLKYEID